jgi:excinuclease UvrABC nuclease subunit
MGRAGDVHASCLKCASLGHRPGQQCAAVATPHVARIDVKPHQVRSVRVDGHLRNADGAAIALQNHLLSRGNRQQAVLEELQRGLNLPGLPNRIEGYDI